MKNLLTPLTLILLTCSACQKADNPQSPAQVQMPNPDVPPTPVENQIHNQALKQAAIEIVSRKSSQTFSKEDFETIGTALDQTDFYYVFIDKISTDPRWTEEVLQKDVSQMSDGASKKAMARIQMIILAAALDDSEIRCKPHQDTKSCEDLIDENIVTFRVALQDIRNYYLNLKSFMQQDLASGCVGGCSTSLSLYIDTLNEKTGLSSRSSEVLKAFANLERSSKTSRWAAKYNSIYQSLVACVDHEAQLIDDLEKSTTLENNKAQITKIDGYAFNCMERPLYFAKQIPFWNQKDKISKTRQQISELLSMVDQSSKCGGLVCADLTKKGALP